MRRRRGAGAERVLATLLFTDIVGSTELAARLGDQGWKQLVARHHAIVRAELKRFGGREQDTAGDGFFATFDRPARAIECAAAIMARLTSLGIRIRAGIHMGEAETMGGKLGGIAVHAAARVLAIAGPGEILVTGTVRDVTAGTATRFVDRGTHELRGVPGEWRLYAVDIPQPTATADATAPAALPEATPAGRRQAAALPLLALVAVALVLAGGLGVAMLARGSPPSPSPVAAGPNSAVRIDPVSRAVSASVPVGRAPGDVALTDDAAWVLGVGGRTVTRIADEGMAQPIGLGGPPTGVAAMSGTVWVTLGFGTQAAVGGELVRFSSTGQRVGQAIRLAPGAREVAAGEGAIWVSNGVGNTLTKIDPGTGTVLGELEVADQPAGVATGQGSVWLVHNVGRTVWRIDPATLEHRDVALAVAPSRVATGFGRVWITSTADNSLVVVDAGTNSVVTTIEIGRSPRAVATGAGAVWVALAGGAVARLDPDDPSRVETISLPAPAEGVAASDDAVWVTVQE